MILPLVLNQHRRAAAQFLGGTVRAHFGRNAKFQYGSLSGGYDQVGDRESPGGR